MADRTVQGGLQGGATMRVRRPRDKSPFVAELVDSGAFATMRDVLVFAAALGWSLGAYKEFEQSDEPIQWQTFINRPGSEALVDMLTAVGDDDPESLADDRLPDRIRRFEGFANGGLIELQQMTADSDLSESLIRLILKQRAQDSIGIESLIEGLA